MSIKYEIIAIDASALNGFNWIKCAVICFDCDKNIKIVECEQSSAVKC